MRIGVYLAEDNVTRILNQITSSLDWNYDYYTDVTSEKFPNLKDYDVFIVNEYWTRWASRQLIAYYKSGELPCVYTSKGFLPGTQIFDAHGYNDQSWIYPRIPRLVRYYSQPRFQRESKKLAERLVTDNLTHYHQSQESDDLVSGSIFLPLQVSIDFSILTQSALGSQNAYAEYLDTVARFCSDHSVRLAVKTHPVADLASREDVVTYLHRYPTDKITEDCILWHIQRFQEERAWVDRTLSRLRQRYGDVLHSVSGNINRLCSQSRFISTINASTCVNAFITQKVISTCGNTMFKGSGTVVYNDDVYSSLETAWQASQQQDPERETKQLAMLYLLMNDFLLVDDSHPEFMHKNVEKLLRQIFLSQQQESQAGYLSLQPHENGEAVFAGQWETIKSLNVNCAGGLMRYPIGTAARRAVPGYRTIEIRPGDTLWGLFRERWQEIWMLEVNRPLREQFDPNYIFPGYFIFAPEKL